MYGKTFFPLKVSHEGHYAVLGFDLQNLFEVGDTVDLSFGGEPGRYEIMAVADYYNLSAYSAHFITSPGFFVYLPGQIFETLLSPNIMSAMVIANSDKRETLKDEIGAILAGNPDVSFRSRTEYAAELETDNRRLALVGMSLCVIVLFIGVLNFINTTITNIMARKYELAMLQAIGMTVKQSKNMLTLECLYFVLIAAGIFVSAGYALTFGIVRAFTESSEAYTYHFTFLPLLLCFLPLCAFAFILPQLVYRSISHSSVVERLREIA